MIGLDTNVVVRYLTQDDPTQSPIANEFIETTLSGSHLGFITLVSLVEIVWVLDACYEQTQDDLIKVIGSLLTTKQFKIESADLVYLALKRYEKGAADFSDAMIALVCEKEKCEKVVTFDKKAKHVGMELLLKK